MNENDSYINLMFSLTITYFFLESNSNHYVKFDFLNYKLRMKYIYTCLIGFFKKRWGCFHWRKFLDK